MKTKIFLGFVLTFLALVVQAQNQTQGVSIAPDETPPSKDAMLDVVSSGKGVLVPRVAYSVISSGILAPANVTATAGQDGLLVFVIDADANYGYWYFDDNVLGGVWKKLASGGGGDLWVKRTDNDNIYNNGFSANKVGVGLNNPVAKFHVSQSTGNDIFIAESNKHVFGLHDYYAQGPNPGGGQIGSASLVIHHAKTQSNMVYAQLDHNYVRRAVLLSAWSSGNPIGYLQFNNNSTAVRNIGGHLNLQASSDLSIAAGGIIWSNQAIANWSDSLFKTDITVMRNNIDNLLLLKGYTYKWRDTSATQDLQYGLMAQNVARVFPTLVSTVSVPTFVNDSTVTYANRLVLNYQGLIPVIIEGLKEQQTLIDSLSNRVATLEEDYEDLLNRIEALETP